ncbi:hypothetical protein WEH80_30195 [Actinomycetes bacterium KLBMP 9759]
MGGARLRLFRPALPALAVLVPTALVAWHGSVYGSWIVEDAGVAFAYARSIATGAGAVPQPGAEPVEAFTSPVWLALHVVGRWSGSFDRGTWFGVPDYVAFPKALGVLTAVAVFAGFHRAAKAVTSHPALVTLVAGALLAAVPSYVVWTVSGLENGLLAAAAVWLVAVMLPAVVDGRLLTPRVAVWCGLLAALAALTRADGVVYLAAYPLVALGLLRRGELRQVGRAVGISVGAFAVPFVASVVWRLVTFGTVLPGSAVTDLHGPLDIGVVVAWFDLVGYLAWPVVAAAVVIVVVAVAHRPADGVPARRPLGAVLVPFGLAGTGYLLLQPDWMEHLRFASSIWAVGALLIVLCALRVVAIVRARRAVLVGGGVAVAVAVVASAPSTVGAALDFGDYPSAPLCVAVEQTGRTVNAYQALVAAPEPTLLASDLGGAALTGTSRIVDLSGAADAHIAGFWAREDWTAFGDYVFATVRPTFVKGSEYTMSETGLGADPRLERDYVEIASDKDLTDWVRRDALRGPAQLDELRTLAETRLQPAVDEARNAGGASCGDRLTP